MNSRGSSRFLPNALDAWLKREDFPAHIRRAIWEDGLARGWFDRKAQPKRSLLAGDARTVFSAYVFDPPIVCRSTDSGEFHGFVVKTPHRFGEPGNSIQASDLMIGPWVLFADESIIVEEYFPDAWRIENCRLKRESLATSFAEAFLVMLRAGFYHGFDNLSAHLFVRTDRSPAHVYLVDWARARRTPLVAEEQERFLVHKLKRICELVLDHASGVRGSCAFRAKFAQARITFPGLGDVVTRLRAELLAQARDVRYFGHVAKRNCLLAGFTGQIYG